MHIYFIVQGQTLEVCNSKIKKKIVLTLQEFCKINLEGKNQILIQIIN